MDNEKYLKEKELLHKYEDILAKEEIFWKQKSRKNWLSDGDKNTKFFHNNTKQRIIVNRILGIKGDRGNLIEDPKGVAMELVSFFQNILNNWSNSDLCSQQHMLANIPKVITEEDDKMLTCKFTLEEIREAVHQLHPEKAP